MKQLVLVLFASQMLVAQNGEQHEFVIKNFHTESGVTLPEARVVYGTYGKSNADKSNVVLLPSHYMANFHGYEWLIGPDRARILHVCFWWRRSCSATAALLRPATRRSRITVPAFP